MANDRRGRLTGDVMTYSDVEKQAEELDKMLGLAENLQERIERQSTTMIIMAIVLAATAAFGAGTALVTVLREAPSVFTITPVVATVTFIAIEAKLLTSMMSHRRRDRRALTEVAQIIHETARSYSETWSALENARFRIRLARIDLGDGFQPSKSD